MFVKKVQIYNTVDSRVTMKSRFVEIYNNIIKLDLEQQYLYLIKNIWKLINKISWIYVEYLP